MTPDMKRLCDAVWSVEATQYFREATGEASSDDASPHERRRYQAIVRAVLTALREAAEEGAKGEYLAENHLYGEVGEAFMEGLDAILADPVKA